MNQTNKASFSLKFSGISILISFVCYFALQFLMAYLLKGISHFESYYFLTPWFSVALIALLISVLSKKCGSSGILNALITSLFFSLLVIISGFIFCRGDYRIFPVVLTLIFLIILSVLFTFALQFFNKKRGRKRRKFGFSK